MNIKYRFIRVVLAAFLFQYSIATASGQEGTPEYTNLMQNGEYAKALQQIEQVLTEKYGERVGDKRIPTDFISVKQAERGIDLEKLFVERKAKPFFIENNPDLFTLHYNAGICADEIKQFDTSLNHLVQSLRYRVLKPEQDHAVYYRIAGVYKKRGDVKAYHAALETAYELKPENYDYSLELGKSLARHGIKKRAIYHLERYVQSRSKPPEDASLYITLANLHAETGRHLNTVKYYREYLEIQPDDANIHFALGTLCYARTGNYPLALASFEKALNLLPEGDVYRRGKSMEYSGDIHLSELNFKIAIQNYTGAIQYQEKLVQEIEKIESDVNSLDKKINSLKSSLLKNRDYSAYTEYEYAVEEKARKELELRRKKHELDKLNPGRVRWNLADAYEHDNQLQEALKWYRQALAMAYQPRKAREKISKLQLKINRGY